MVTKTSYFFDAITRFTEEAVKEVAEETAKTARGILNTIIDYSPMDTGRFLANWQIGPTDVSYSTIGTSNYLAKQAEVNSTVTSDYFKHYDRVYMVNNVSYAKKVEEDGWQITAKYAPVARTIAHFSGGTA